MTRSRKIDMQVYYALNKDRLLAKAIARYRKHNEELKKQAREKYIPKTQRHSIYR